VPRFVATPLFRSLAKKGAEQVWSQACTGSAFHIWNNPGSTARLLLHVADEQRKYQVDNHAGSSRRRAVGG